MKKYDVYCGLFWLIMAIFVSGTSLLKLRLGSLKYPGPGFFPFLIGLLLLFLSLNIIIPAMKEWQRDHTFKEWPSFSIKTLTTLAILFIYAIFLEFTGFFIGSFLLLLYIFKVPAGRKWWVSILMTAIVTCLSYYLFGVILKAQLPKGTFNIG
jgi:hypothetical protein